MAKPMFILNGEDNQIGIEYTCGMFPQIPNYHKRDSWFLLAFYFIAGRLPETEPRALGSSGNGL